MDDGIPTIYWRAARPTIGGCKDGQWPQIASRRDTNLARQQYADHGVDTDAALARARRRFPISLHCWQGDDVGGFENAGEALGGGLAATGQLPGQGAHARRAARATRPRRSSLIPGTHRFNLHAFYGEFGGKRVDRDEIGPEHFAGWIDWAKSHGIGLDFNPTFFSHPEGRRRLHARPPRRRRSARSGSGTASPAGRSARRWARRSARRA